MTSRVAQFRLERVDDGFIVDDPETGIYGQGRSADEAFGDFIDALTEYRQILASEAPHLSPRLTEHLQLLMETFGEP